MSLVAAACGSADGTEATAGPESSAAPAPTAAEPADPGTAASADEGESAPADDQAQAPADAPAAENLFPDIEVTRISDGEPVNLSDELAGGDLPVLLWFWAPH